MLTMTLSAHAPSCASNPGLSKHSKIGGVPPHKSGYAKAERLGDPSAIMASSVGDGAIAPRAKAHRATGQRQN
jgi:hypothetical protein